MRSRVRERITCDNFRQLVRRECAPLMDQYGFTVVGERDQEHDCGIKFQNATTRIEILRESGPPWIVVSSTETVKPMAIRTSIDLIAHSLGEERSIMDTDHVDGLTKWLREQLRILRVVEPVLHGDFSVIENTRQLMESLAQHLDEGHGSTESDV